MRSLPVRPAPCGAAAWWTTDQQPGHPNLGVSRKQESGHQAATIILTVESIPDRADRGHQAGQGQGFPEPHRRVLIRLNRWTQHPRSGGCCGTSVGLGS